MPGGAGGKGEKGAKDGGKGPGPKAQLAALVTKLDLLTSNSLRFELTPEQKAKAKELLAGFAEKDEPSDDDAKDKMDKLLATIRAEQEGARRPQRHVPTPARGRGRRTRRYRGRAPNPLTVGDGAAHLKSLKETLSK